MDHARLIITEGLQPRKITQIAAHQTKWGAANMASLDDLVYLTDLQGPFFAAAASVIMGGDPAVVEVSLEPADQQNFGPDEDYLAAVLLEEQGAPWFVSATKMQMAQEQAKAQLESRASLWRDSLEKLSSVAHRGAIAPDRVIRAWHLPMSSRQAKLILSLTHTMRELDARTVRKIGLGPRRRRTSDALTRWMLGEPITTDDFQTYSERLQKEARSVLRDLLSRRPVPIGLCGPRP